MKIIISGTFENYPVVIETEAVPKQLPGIIQELLDVGIAPPESLSEFVKQVDAQVATGNRRQLTTSNPPPTSETTNVCAPLCQIHQSPMRPGNKGGFFCARKNPNGEWCDQRITEKKVAKADGQPKQTSFVTTQPVNEHGF